MLEPSIDKDDNDYGYVIHTSFMDLRPTLARREDLAW